MTDKSSDKLSATRVPASQPRWRPPLTISDILAMTEEYLRTECLQSEIPTSGLDKITIQKQLLEHLGIF